ncbi:hypothetical protein EJ08DRAFT_673745 [Tothia fuscella]|uniref:ER membrane protein complex subunit 2 n=1 Tax=Tothia fuscella TaxID=1048955 RepID=A0A9P4NEB0_9PEZI|nr:hypothetical protein EJ08DRAFT_673745 [Tothia fuscella]
MSVDLVYPPPNISPKTALQISQRAPQVLKSSSQTLPFPLSLLSGDDTPEKWTTYENLFVSCLRTGDDKSARQILDKLLRRFGDKNERVMAYQGMMAEANAETEQEAIKMLREYGEELESDPTNLPIQKRRIALLTSMGKIQEAISMLGDLLVISPTDAEAWAELSDLYFGQSLYDQATFCLEEVLLVMPNAWNMHARLAEVIYLSTIATSSDKPGDLLRGLAESMRRYCRSVELCNNYLRGYYGLKVVRPSLLPKAPKSEKNTPDAAYSDLPLPTLSTVERLHELATAKLGEIVRKSAAGEKGWEGYDGAETIAARELLDRDTKSISS